MRELPLWLVLAVLRLSGRSRRFRTVARFEASVRKNRAANDGDPPPDLQAVVSLTPETWGGVHGWRLAPVGGAASDAPRLVHLHGGAHCTEIGPQQWRFLAHLVQATGCIAHVPLFPLAPEAGHRQVKDAVDAWWQALRAATPAARWLLSGDSSGGGLALLMSQRWLARGQAQPERLLLIAPWLDLSLGFARPLAAQVRDPWLEVPGVERAAQMWADGTATDSPEVSPLHGSLAGLPPASLFYGTRDLLVGECRELVRRAAAAGWPLEVEEAPGMIHVYPILPLKAGRAARERIAAHLRGQA